MNYGVYYFCYNGFIYPTSLKAKGVAVNSGETVEVVVNLTKGKVEFKVDGIIKATVENNEVLTEPNRSFVPSIEMTSIND